MKVKDLVEVLCDYATLHIIGTYEYYGIHEIKPSYLEKEILKIDVYDDDNILGIKLKKEDNE